MRQLDHFSALQSGTEGIDNEFKSTRGGLANNQGGAIFFWCGRKAHRLRVGPALSGESVVSGASVGKGPSV